MTDFWLERQRFVRVEDGIPGCLLANTGEFQGEQI